MILSCELDPLLFATVLNNHLIIFASGIVKLILFLSHSFFSQQSSKLRGTHSSAPFHETLYCELSVLFIFYCFLRSFSFIFFPVGSSLFWDGQW